MQIQWTSVDERMPEEGKKVYIQGENFVCQAYYHIGMYWQDANNGTQRHALGAVTQWAEVDHVQEVVDHVADKVMEHERHGLQYTPTETLEQMAEEYSKGRWATEGEIEAAYRGYLAGYCQALEFNSPEKLDSWISVKDRLPQIDQEVIVAVPFVYADENGPTNHKGCGIRTAWLVPDAEGAKWSIHTEDGWVTKVTHWMSFPAAPKEAI